MITLLIDFYSVQGCKYSFFFTFGSKRNSNICIWQWFCCLCI